MRKDATTKVRDLGFVFQRTVVFGPAEDSGMVPWSVDSPIHDRVLARLPAGCVVFILARGPNEGVYPVLLNNNLATCHERSPKEIDSP